MQIVPSQGRSKANTKTYKKIRWFFVGICMTVICTVLFWKVVAFPLFDLTHATLAGWSLFIVTIFSILLAIRNWPDYDDSQDVEKFILRSRDKNQ